MDEQAASSQPGTTQTNSGKRRRRPPLACVDCRRRKVRCDRKIPCQNCVRARRATSCSYVPDERLRIEPREGTQGFHDGINGRSADKDDVVSMPFPSRSTTETSTRGTRDLRDIRDTRGGGAESSATALAERVRQLEHRLAHVQSPDDSAAASRDPSPTRPETAAFLGAEYWHLSDEASRAGRPHTVKNASSGLVMMAKNKYLGPSHWVHGVVLFPRSSLVMTMLGNAISDKTSATYRAIAEAKVTGRAIKAARVPRLISSEYGQSMPCRDYADELLDAYFRTFESVYRILHIPSFRLEYDRYWQNPKGARAAFVIQLQLCLALGAVTHDQTFSLRNLAVRWIYEARMWMIMQPSEKSRVNLSGLQVLCLIHLARQVCGVSSDLIWCEAGTLMRTALYIGLHRDPEKLPKMSLLAAETRRRLWATILEILVQSSMECGGPPLVSEGDYDVQPPRNYNDEDLLGDDDNGQIPSPHPVATLTDSAVQIALLSTVKARLHIANYLNQFRSISSYNKTLALNADLTAASRGLDTLLHMYQSQNSSPLTFPLCETEHVIQRYFLALHMPWLSLAKDDPRYFLSRKLCVEVGLRNQDTAKAHGFLGSANGAEPDDFGRLLLCASGSHRYLGTQCVFVLTIQLFWELEEHRQTLKNLGVSIPAGTSWPSSPSVRMSPDVSQGNKMLEAIRNSARWVRCRIQAGEMNVKGYVFARAMSAELDGLQRGLSAEQLQSLVFESTKESAVDALGILKGLHAMICPADDEDMPMTAAAVPTPAVAEESAMTQAAMEGTQIPALSEEFGSADPRLGGSGEMGDWEWDMLQDSSFNLNIRLGGMELMFEGLDS